MSLSPCRGGLTKVNAVHPQRDMPRCRAAPHGEYGPYYAVLGVNMSVKPVISPVTVEERIFQAALCVVCVVEAWSPHATACRVVE